MRKIGYLLIYIIIMTAAACSNGAAEKTSAAIYFVDAELNRLIPYEREITAGDSETMAKSAIEVIIEGDDSNGNIRRLIPKIKDCVTVSVRENIACVDFASAIKADLPKSRDIERLLIYQIVNTLTQLKGIRFVEFTVDGEHIREFMGFYDMREIFKYKYPE